MAMRFSCLVFLLLWWDASTEDVIPWCLRSGSSCHGNKWTMKNVENVSHYLPNASLLAHPLRLADWDMDGDLDVVVLMEHGLWLYKMIEIGQSFSGPFELNSSTLNVNENSYLEVADFNGDGYPDVLIAEQLPSPPDRQDWCKEEGKIRYFEQWPSSLGMELNERTGSENPFNHIKIPCSDQYTNLQLVDWNADGALDLFVYSPHTMAAFLPSGAPSSIKVLYFESQNGDLVEATNRHFKDLDFSIAKEGYVKEVRLADWDGDGDQDMLLLCKQCKHSSCKTILSYIEQLADGSLVLMPDGWQHISLQHDARLLQMVDWNRDNISDLVVSDRIFQRNPSAAASFTRRKGAQNPFGGLAFSSGEPHLVDWDGDGDLDLLVVERYNVTHPKIRIFELLDTGELVEMTVKYDHIPLVTSYGPSGLQFFDWNNDGDVDLAVLTPNGVLDFFDNHNGVLSERPHLSMRISGVPDTAMLSISTIFHMGDWDGDGDFDVILGPVTSRFHAYSETDSYTTGYYLEQVNGTLIYRPDHPLVTAFASVGKERDLSWKILDCDGDGNLDIIRFQMRPTFPLRFVPTDIDIPESDSLEVNFLTGPFVGSCSQQKGKLKCDNSCFKGPAAYTRLEVGEHGHLTAGDWDGDGDLDILGIAAGHNSPLIFFDQNYCLPPTPCSGIGRCMASGRCACGKERDLEDCSGCSASHYTVSKTPGLSLVHRCAPCPMNNNQVCAGRGVCVDDIYARAVGNSWDLGNGSCVCAAASFHGTDQFFRQTCAEGTCPGGFQEVHMPAERLKHPKIKTCLACQVCNPGTSAPAGGRCESCHPGNFSTGGSDFCRPCPAGTESQTVGTIECNSCPAGTFAPLGSAVCQICPEGAISGSGSATCEPCNSQSIFWVHTDSENLSCIRPSEQYLILLLFFASSSVCCFFVATALAYRIAVSDISTQNDGAVVTTHGAHRVLQASSVTLVQAKATHVPDLSTPCSAEFISDERLKLYRDLEVGDAIKSAESSVGWLVLGVGTALRQTGYLQVPLMIWITASLVSAILSAATGLLTSATIGLALFFAVVSVATQQLWHQYVGAQTPISKSRLVFLKKIQTAEKLVDRGAARGVGYPELLSFYEFFQSFIKHRSMYYVSSNLVVPLTEKNKVSFSELVGPKLLTWFVSHFWGMAVPHFMESIQHHAMQVADQDRLSYWVCTFSIRQHGESVVQEEVGHGVIEQSSFYYAMWDANCCGTALVLDSKVRTLRRIWCLFEVFQTFRHEKEQSECAKTAESALCKPFEGLLLCTSTGVLSKGAGGTDVCMAIAKKLASIDLQAAESSKDQDKTLIFDLIERSGGFAPMNACVQKSIRQALLKVHSRFERDFSELVDTLNTSAPSASSGGARSSNGCSRILSI